MRLSWCQDSRTGSSVQTITKNLLIYYQRTLGKLAVGTGLSSYRISSLNSALLFQSKLILVTQKQLKIITQFAGISTNPQPSCRSCVCSRLTAASNIKIMSIVLQRRPKKEEGTGSRITTFVCMSKINHWDVGVTKLRDDIVRSVCNLHTAPFSNFPDPISRVLCSTGWISWSQTIGFLGQTIQQRYFKVG